MSETTWHDFSETPAIGSKFIALYDDGSGAVLYFRHDGGYIDQDGDEHETLKHLERWAYLPAGFEFHCEGGEEPVTLPRWDGAAAPAPTVSGEPVAWMYEFTEVISGTVTMRLSDTDPTGSSRRVGNVTPLYTHPAPTRAEVLEEAISAAATAWCGDKDRETFPDDIAYFKHNWRALRGLRAYVEREIGRRALAGEKP